MASRRIAVAVVAYALAAIGGVIYARQLEYLAPLWCVIVLGYALVLIDGRFVRAARQG